MPFSHKCGFKADKLTACLDGENSEHKICQDLHLKNHALKVTRTVAPGQIYEPYPLDSLTDAEVPSGSDFVNNGLRYSFDTDSRVLDTPVPWFIETLADTDPVSKSSADPVGRKVLNCGRREEYGLLRVGRPTGIETPFDGDLCFARVTNENATACSFDLKVRNSSDVTFDFTQVAIFPAVGNPFLVGVVDNFGTPCDPYIPATFSITLQPNDVLRVLFQKSFVNQAGVDSTYFYLEKLRTAEPDTQLTVCRDDVEIFNYNSITDLDLIDNCTLLKCLDLQKSDVLKLSFNDQLLTDVNVQLVATVDGATKVLEDMSFDKKVNIEGNTTIGGKANISGDVQIDGNLCVNGLVSVGENGSLPGDEFLGKYLSYSKASIQRVALEIFRDKTNKQIFVNIFKGNHTNLVSTVLLPGSFPDQPNIRSFTWIVKTTNGITYLQYSSRSAPEVGEEDWSQIKFDTIWKDSNNPDFIYFGRLTQNQPVDFTQAYTNARNLRFNALFKKVENLSVYDKTSLEDYDNPQYLIDHWFERSVILNTTSTNNKPNIKGQDYPGFNAMKARLEQMKTTGITYNSQVVNVLPTLSNRQPIGVTQIKSVTGGAIGGGSFILNTDIGAGTAPYLLLAGVFLDVGLLVQLSGVTSITGSNPLERINSYFRVIITSIAGGTLLVPVVNSALFEGGFSDILNGQYTIHSLVVTTDDSTYGVSRPLIFGDVDSTITDALGINNNTLANKDFIQQSSGSIFSSPVPDTYIIDVDVNDPPSNTVTLNAGTVPAVNPGTVPTSKELIEAAQANQDPVVGYFTQGFGIISSRLYSTTIFTNQSHNVHCGGLINITGFNGEYAVLNGTHKTFDTFYHIKNQARAYETVLTDGSYDKPNATFSFDIPFDSNGLPPYDVNVHGAANIEVVYAPVTPTASYRETIGGIVELQNLLGVNTHSVLFYWTDPTDPTFSIYETLSDAQKFLGTGAPISLLGVTTRSVISEEGAINASVNSFVLNNAKYYNDLPVNSVNGNNIDQSLRYNVFTDKYWPTWAARNYRASTNRYWQIGYRVATPDNPEYLPPNPDPFHLSNNMASVNFNANGLGIEFRALHAFNSPQEPLALPGNDTSNNDFATGVDRQIIIEYSCNGNTGTYFAAKGLGIQPVTIDLSNVELVKADPVRADSPLTNAAEINGRVAVYLLTDGSNGDAEYQNCIDAGAIAVIAVNERTTTFVYGIQDDEYVFLLSSNGTVPTMMLSIKDGNETDGLLSILSTTASPNCTAVIRGYQMDLLGSNWRFGLINSDFTNGKKVGHILIPASISGVYTPPLTRAEWGPQFDGKEGSEYGNTIYFMEKMMTTDLDGNGTTLANCDSIILDSRYNTGGLEPHRVLGHFFGDNRNGDRLETILADTGNSEPVAYNGGNPADGESVAIQNLSIIDVQKTKTLPGISPSAFFEGAGKKVFLLNSVNSVSAGDLFSVYWRGPPNAPNDLGAGVTVEYIGNCDGRLVGASNNEVNAVWGNAASTLKYQPSVNGNEFPLWYYRTQSENGSNVRIDINSNIAHTRQSYKQDMDLLLNSLPEENLYQDVGFADLSPSRLVDVFGTNFPPMDKDDFTTFRDRWLEETIKRASV